MSLTSYIYASAARARRRWYERRPAERRRRLDRPVVSVGNLRVGGSGKTPVVAHLARLLVEMGERPAVLTRGYARRRPQDGVTVVSDGRRLLADLDTAGDEPLMLARSLACVPVLVSADRFLAGRLAERRFGCTVHLLDDGFQHFQLARDVDLVLTGPDDLAAPQTLPSGRLREPLDVARAADALILSGADDAEAVRIGETLRVADVFRVRYLAERVRFAEPGGRPLSPAAGRRVLAVAGIARPERFFAMLASEGWTVAGEVVFPDHHHFAAADLERVANAMRDARAVMVMTTEKDLMRLLPLRPLPFPLAWLPLRAVVEPVDAFREWLRARIHPSGAEN